MKNNRFLSREGKRSEMEDKIGGQKRASLTVCGGGDDSSTSKKIEIGKTTNEFPYPKMSEIAFFLIQFAEISGSF